MKVLELVADGAPGGGTTVVLALVEDTAAQDDWQVHLCTQDQSYGLARGKALGVGTTGVDFFRGRLSFEPPRRLRALIAAERPDLIHVHGARAGLSLSRAMAPGARPVLYTVHGYHFEQKPWPLKRLAMMAERRISQFADHTVFVCEHDRKLAQTHGLLGQRPSSVVYNGILPDELPPAAPDDPKRIAFLGRLCDQKHPEMVIDVAEELAEEGFTFVVVGGGDLLESLRESVERRGLSSIISLTGALPRDEALEAIRSAGILMMPSRWEGFPMVPLEAMSMGIPVVAAAVSGVPEVIEYERNGLLVGDRSAGAYASALRRIAGDAAFRQSMILAARETVNGRFLRRHMSQAYLDLYEGLVDRQRAGA